MYYLISDKGTVECQWSPIKLCWDNFMNRSAQDITLSIKMGGAAALGGIFCCGVIVIEVRDGDGLCRIGAGPLGCRGPPGLFPCRNAGGGPP